jgi:hypothetical protein
MPHRHVGGLPSSLKLLKTQLIDHEFHAGLVTVFSVAEGIEHFDDCLNAGNQFFHRSEIPQQLGDPWSGTQSSARHHAKTDLTVGSFHRQQADVVDRSQSAIVRTAGERNFELSRETLIQGVP